MGKVVEVILENFEVQAASGDGGDLEVQGSCFVKKGSRGSDGFFVEEGAQHMWSVPGDGYVTVSVGSFWHINRRVTMVLDFPHMFLGVGGRLIDNDDGPSDILENWLFIPYNDIVPEQRHHWVIHNDRGQTIQTNWKVKLITEF